MRSLKTIPNKRRLVLAACLLGLVSGLAGILLHYLLELVEGLAFGRSEHQFDFLTDGVPPSRIWLSLFLVGASSALVWYLLQRKGNILSIKGQMKEEPSRPRLHFWEQMLHSTWQIIAVGAGAPVGKEGAPREIGALLATPLGRALDLSFKDRIFLIACGAGAGLAAVYQVPLTSVFFIFETLGLAFSMKRFVLAGITTYVAAYTAGWVISDRALYQVPEITWSPTVLWQMVIFITFLTPVAWLFARFTKKASNHRIRTNDSYHFAISICFPSWSSELPAPPAWKWADDGSGNPQWGHMADNLSSINPKSSSRSGYLLGRCLWRDSDAFLCTGNGRSSPHLFGTWCWKYSSFLSPRFGLLFDSDLKSSLICNWLGPWVYGTRVNSSTLSLADSFSNCWFLQRIGSSHGGKKSRSLQLDKIQ